MRKGAMSLFWVIGIILLLNFLSREFFFRIDATKDKTYTLSKATRNILTELEEPITVTSYFTKDLPPQYAKTLSDFNDLLSEYNTRSKGTVNFEYKNPNENPETEQEAVQNGIQPLLINVREKDEVVQKRAFMGAVVKKGDLQEILPFITPGGPMEYQLTTAIKKISVADKPSIGFVQGHGEASFEQIGQVYEALNVLYNVEPVNLSSGEVPAHIKTVVMLSPKDSIMGSDFQVLDTYLNNGGNVVLAYNSVFGNFQTVQGEERNLGIGDWLRTKSIEVPSQFVMDASCGSISVQQKQSFFSYNSQVKFPYLPLINKFEEHPITEGVDQAIFQFPSPITYTGSDGFTFTPLVKTSSKSKTQDLPVSFDVQKKWTTRDFPQGPVTIAAVVEGDFGSTGTTSSLVVFTDGEFPIAQGRQAQSNSDNFNLLVNSVDVLSDDTGLIDLRTKGVASRPIEELEDSRKSFLKWLNFLLPILLVLVLGFFRYQKSRNLRLRRASERYVYEK